MTDGEPAEGKDVSSAGATDAMGDRPRPDEPGAAPDVPGSRRGAAVCVACGAAYAVERCADGRVIPIGSRTGCRCGSDEFRLL